MDHKVERLRAIELFASLPDRDLRRISRLVYELDRPAGAVLMEEGSSGLEAFVIVAGRVSVTRGGRPFGVLGAGEVVGEFALIDRGRRSATAVAETDVSLLVLDLHEFERLLHEVPVVADRLMAMLVGRVRSANRALDRT
jgi:CRP-like cAMP-binding protein